MTKSAIFSALIAMTTAALNGCCSLHVAMCDPWWAFRHPSGAQIIPVETDDGSVAEQAEYLYGGDKYLLKTTTYRTIAVESGSGRGVALLLKLEIKDGSSRPEIQPSAIGLSCSCGVMPAVKNAHGSWASRDLYIAESEFIYPEPCACFSASGNAGSKCRITVEYGQFVRYHDTIAALAPVIALDSDSGWAAYLTSLERK